MSEIPEGLDHPIHRQWPSFAIGVVLFGSGFALRYWFDSIVLSSIFFIVGALFLGYARFLSSVEIAQQSLKHRQELKSGEREYLWQAAYRWLKRKFSK
jgi:hypothetical protein